MYIYCTQTKKHKICYIYEAKASYFITYKSALVNKIGESIPHWEPSN